MPGVLHHRPNGAHGGKTPYYSLREKLQSIHEMSRERVAITDKHILAQPPKIVSQNITQAAMFFLPAENGLLSKTVIVGMAWR